jgi:HSP20 family molecular chaperone IbpA
MFGKTKCKKCGEKVSDNYNYCPYCQMPLKDMFDEQDWGLLGKNDFIDPQEIKMPMGLNALFNSLMKNLDTQMKELDKQTKAPSKEQKVSKKSGGISISISTSGNHPPEIKVRSFGNAPEFQNKKKEMKKKANSIKLPGSDSGKFAGLPKKEPETNIRRFSNKVVYEIKMPGVKTIKDLSIIQLENSIEIKALANGKVFYKIIPINLPINNYNLSSGVLTLELDSSQ